MALKRAAKDTRLQGRDEAHAERPSARDAPRALLTMNQSSPSLTSVTGGSLSLIHPPAIHGTHSHLSILDAKGQRHRHLPVAMKRRPPAQGKKDPFENKSKDPETPHHLAISDEWQDFLPCFAFGLRFSPLHSLALSFLAASRRRQGAPLPGHLS